MVVGMPRSGTSWLGQILDSNPKVAYRLSPIFSYSMKNCVNEKSKKADFEWMFKKAFISANDEFMNQTNKRKDGLFPIFEKVEPPEILVIKMTRYHNLITKILELFDDLQMVSIIRNPCGAIYSWLTTEKEFPKTANPKKEWRTGQCRKTGPEEFWGFNDWKYVTYLHLGLEQRFPKRFRIIQYESLVENPRKETKLLYKFLGLEFTKQTEDFLVNSQNVHISDPYSVFKKPSTKDKWRNRLDKEVQFEIYEDIKDSPLSRFLEY